MSAGLAIPKVPSKLILEPVLTDEEFEQLCAANSKLAIERTKEGEIVVNAPAGSGSSAGNALITHQLVTWWADSSSKGPAAAYITDEQVKVMRPDDLDHFLRFIPAFIAELRSSTDSLPMAKEKIEKWIRSGAQLAWLIDPRERSVFVYEKGMEPRIESGATVHGTGPVESFTLDLAKLWRVFQL